MQENSNNKNSRTNGKTRANFPTQAKKISELPLITAADIQENDLLIINQSDGTKTINIQDLYNLIGSIQMFAFDPTDVGLDGYLRCDGAEYLKVDYPKLYTKIGDLWGNTDLGYEAPTDADHFRVPNLLDRFIRNMDGEGTRTVATRQDDTMQKMTGSIFNIGNQSPSGTNGVFKWSQSGKMTLSTDGGSARSNYTFDSSRVVRTDSKNETRPKNVTLDFWIKAK